MATTAKKTATATPAPAKNAKGTAKAGTPRRTRKEAAENLKRAKAEIAKAKKARAKGGDEDVRPRVLKQRDADRTAAPAKVATIAKAIDKHQRKAGARADGLTPNTGAARLVDALSRKEGATNAELCEASGWAACLPAARKAAARAGLRFEAVKKPGELTRYFARKNGK